MGEKTVSFISGYTALSAPTQQMCGEQKMKEGINEIELTS